MVFKDGRLRGWALGARGQSIEITATDLATGETVWKGLADEPRENARFANKRCGFEFVVGGRFVQAGEGIKFVDGESSSELPFSPLRFTEEHEAHVQRLNELSNWPLLHLQGVKEEKGRIICRIVAVPAASEAQDSPALFVENADGISRLEGKEVRPVYPTTRAVRHFWYSRTWPKTNLSVDLTRSFAAPLRDESGTPFVRLIVDSEENRDSLSATRDAGLVSEGAVKVPPESNVRRTQAGGLIDQKFTASAFSQYRTYRQVFERYGDKGWQEIRTVLDWGCGAGRVTQQLMRSLGKERVHGVDIDGGNIEWCLANLDSPNFKRCELLPPLPYPDESFDYIVATSVLTHIHEAIQSQWLDDLRRVLAPGGLAALSVGTETRMAFGSYDLDRIKAVEARGIEDSTANSQLDDAIDDKDYYRNVRMSKAYIRDRWDAHFEVLDIIDHAIGVQDIVVCRKRV